MHNRFTFTKSQRLLHPLKVLRIVCVCLLFASLVVFLRVPLLVGIGGFLLVVAIELFVLMKFLKVAQKATMKSDDTLK